jgi:hypothetical protein
MELYGFVRFTSSLARKIASGSKICRRIYPRLSSGLNLGVLVAGS